MRLSGQTVPQRANTETKRALAWPSGGSCDWPHLVTVLCRLHQHQESFHLYPEIWEVVVALKRMALMFSLKIAESSKFRTHSQNLSHQNNPDVSAHIGDHLDFCCNYAGVTCLSYISRQQFQCLYLQGEGAEEGVRTTTPSAGTDHPVGKPCLVKWLSYSCCQWFHTLEHVHCETKDE